jgi:hypothetical protein
MNLPLFQPKPPESTESFLISRRLKHSLAREGARTAFGQRALSDGEIFGYRVSAMKRGGVKAKIQGSMVFVAGAFMQGTEMISVTQKGKASLRRRR